MCDIDWIDKLSYSVNKNKEVKGKSDEAQKILADFLKKKNPKNLNKAFELISDSNKIDPTYLDSYLALSCMYYIKGKGVIL